MNVWEKSDAWLPNYGIGTGVCFAKCIELCQSNWNSQQRTKNMVWQKSLISITKPVSKFTSKNVLSM